MASVSSDELSKTEEDLSKNFCFHLVICCGKTSYFLANSLKLNRSLIASMATFALKDPLNFLRVFLILSTSLNLIILILTSGPILGEYYILDIFKTNGIPKIIPIKREEDYHTHYIGKLGDGRQFFGYQTFVFPNGMPKSNWENARKEYVVLYLFDNMGNFLETKHQYLGLTSEISRSSTEEQLIQMIDEMGTVEYCDIQVKPFQTTIDGIVFGLVANEQHKIVNLEPSSTISFHEPWNGEYDT